MAFSFKNAISKLASKITGDDDDDKKKKEKIQPLQTTSVSPTSSKSVTKNGTDFSVDTTSNAAFQTQNAKTTNNAAITKAATNTRAGNNKGINATKINTSAFSGTSKGTGNQSLYDKYKPLDVEKSGVTDFSALKANSVRVKDSSGSKSGLSTKSKSKINEAAINSSHMDSTVKASIRAYNADIDASTAKTTKTNTKALDVDDTSFGNGKNARGHWLLDSNGRVSTGAKVGDNYEDENGVEKTITKIYSDGSVEGDTTHWLDRFKEGYDSTPKVKTTAKRVVDLDTGVTPKGASVGDTSTTKNGTYTIHSVFSDGSYQTQEQYDAMQKAKAAKAKYTDANSDEARAAYQNTYMNSLYGEGNWGYDENGKLYHGQEQAAAKGKTTSDDLAKMQKAGYFKQTNSELASAGKGDERTSQYKEAGFLQKLSNAMQTASKTDEKEAQAARDDNTVIGNAATALEEAVRSGDTDAGNTNHGIVQNHYGAINDTSGQSVDYWANVGYMNDTQRRTYNYLYETQGKDAANRYYDALDRTQLQEQNYNAQTGIITKEAENADGDLGKQAALSAYSVVANIASAPQGIANTVKLASNALGIGDYKPITGKTDFDALSSDANNIRSAITENIGDEHPHLQRLYNAAMSVADFFAYSAALAPVGTIAGGVAKGAGATAEAATKASQKALQRGIMSAFYSSSAQQTILSTLDRGGTQDQALANGLLNGMEEVLAEKLPTGIFTKGMYGLGGVGVKGLASQVVKGVFGEGVEEGATQIAQSLTDTIIMGDKSEWSQLKDYYMTQGLSEDEAVKAANEQTYVTAVIDAACTGALAGAGMGAGASLVGTFKVGSDIKNDSKYARTLVNNAKRDWIYNNLSDKSKKTLDKLEASQNVGIWEAADLKSDMQDAAVKSTKADMDGIMKDLGVNGADRMIVKLAANSDRENGGYATKVITDAVNRKVEEMKGVMYSANNGTATDEQLESLDDFNVTAQKLLYSNLLADESKTALSQFVATTQDGVQVAGDAVIDNEPKTDIAEVQTANDTTTDANVSVMSAEMPLEAAAVSEETTTPDVEINLSKQVSTPQTARYTAANEIESSRLSAAKEAAQAKWKNFDYDIVDETKNKLTFYKVQNFDSDTEPMIVSKYVVPFKNGEVDTARMKSPDIAGDRIMDKSSYVPDDYTGFDVNTQKAREALWLDENGNHSPNYNTASEYAKRIDSVNAQSAALEQPVIETAAVEAKAEEAPTIEIVEEETPATETPAEEVTEPQAEEVVEPQAEETAEETASLEEVTDEKQTEEKTDDKSESKETKAAKKSTEVKKAEAAETTGRTYKSPSADETQNILTRKLGRSGSVAYSELALSGKVGKSKSGVKASSRDAAFFYNKGMNTSDTTFETYWNGLKDKKLDEASAKRMFDAGVRDSLRMRSNIARTTNGVDKTANAYKKAKNVIGKATVNELDTMGKMLGVTIKFVDRIPNESAATQGITLNNKSEMYIRVDDNATDPIQFLAVHEAVHRLRSVSPKAYNELAEYLKDRITDADFRTMIGEKRRSYKGLSDEMLSEEVIANLTAKMLTSENATRDFAKTHSAVMQKIIDFINDLLDMIKFWKVRADAKVMSLTETERNALNDLERDATELRDIFATAINQAASEQLLEEDVQISADINADTVDAEEVQRSVVDIFNDDKTKNGNERKTFTPHRIMELLEKAGYSEADIERMRVDEFINGRNIIPKSEVVKYFSDYYQLMSDTIDAVREEGIIREEAEVFTPKATAEGKVRRVVDSAMNSSRIDNKTTAETMRDVLRGKYSYVPTSNVKDANAANDIIEAQGIDGAIAVWNKVVEDDRLPSATDIALAENLLEKLSKSEGYSDRYQTILGQLAFVGTKAGQATQAFSMLHKSPSRARSEYLRTYINHLNHENLGRTDLHGDERWKKEAERYRKQIEDLKKQYGVDENAAALKKSKKIKKLGEKFSEAADELESASKDNKAAEDELEKLRKQRDDLLKETGDADELTKAIEEIDRLQDELNSYDMQKDGNDIILDDLEEQRAELKKQITKRKRQIESARQSKKKDKKLIDSLNDDLNKLNAELAGLETDYEKAKADEASIKRATRNAEKRIVRLNDVIAKSNAMTSELIDQLTKLNESIRQAGYAAEKARGRFIATNAIFKSLKDQYLSLTRSTLREDDKSQDIIDAIEMRLAPTAEELEALGLTREEYDELENLSLTRQRNNIVRLTPYQMAEQSVDAMKEFFDEKGAGMLYEDWKEQVLAQFEDAQSAYEEARADRKTLEKGEKELSKLQRRLEKDLAVADRVVDKEREAINELITNFNSFVREETVEEEAPIEPAISEQMDAILEMFKDRYSDAKSEEEFKALKAEILEQAEINEAKIESLKDEQQSLRKVEMEIHRLENELRRMGAITVPEYLLQQLSIESDPIEQRRLEDEIVNEIVKQIKPSLGSKINAFRYLAMLGNVRTHARNIYGNILMSIVKASKDVNAAMLEKTMKKHGMTTTKSVKAMTPKMRAAYSAFLKEDTEDIMAALAGGEKYDIRDAIRKKVKTFEKSRALNALTNFNSAALEAEDVFFLKKHYQSAMRQYLVANGITPEMLENQTDELNEKLAKAREYAITEAQKATFRDYNAASQALSRLSRHDPLAHVLIEGVLPFKGVPINIARRGILEYSPIGLLRGSISLVNSLRSMKNAGRVGNVNYADFEEELSKAFDLMGSGITGSVLVVLGVLLHAAGVLFVPDDDDTEEKIKKAMGIQDYAITIPSTDTNITIDWTAPSALPLFFGAELSAAAERISELTAEDVNAWDYVNAIFTSAEKTVQPLFELSMLSGVQTLLETIQESDNSYTEDGQSAIVSGLENIVISFASQMFPTLGGQLVRITREDAPGTFYDRNSHLSKVLQKAIQKMFNKTPLLAGAADAVKDSFAYDYKPVKAVTDFFDKNTDIAYHGSWGQKESASGVLGTLMKVFNNTLNPSYVSTYKEEPVDQEILRLYQSLGDDKTSELTYLGWTGSTFSTGEGEDKTEYKLTYEEWAPYQEYYGSKVLNAFSAYIKTSGYQGMSDEDKAKALATMQNYYLEEARVKFVDGYTPDENLYNQVNEQKANGMTVADYVTARTVTGKNDVTKEFVDTLKASGVTVAEYASAKETLTERGYSNASETVSSYDILANKNEYGLDDTAAENVASINYSSLKTALTAGDFKGSTRLDIYKQAIADGVTTEMIADARQYLNDKNLTHSKANIDAAAEAVAPEHKYWLRYVLDPTAKWSAGVSSSSKSSSSKRSSSKSSSSKKSSKKKTIDYASLT